MVRIFCNIIFVILLFPFCHKTKSIKMEKEYIQLKEIIYNYYPQNIFFGDPKYFDSIQFEKLQLICETPQKEPEYESFKNSLKVIFVDKYINDFSLLHDNHPSFSTRIAYQKEGDVIKYLVINVSLIAKRYFIYASEVNTLTGVTDPIFSSTDQQVKSMEKIVEDKIKIYFPEYEPLPNTLAFMKVPLVSTGKRELNNATIFDCLFSDHIW